MLTAHLFGIPQIKCHGLEIHIPRTRARQIFYYLITERDAIHRDALADIFWDIDISQEEKRQRLKSTLAQLRRALRQYCGDTQIILSRERKIWLERTYFDEVDIWRWEENYQKIRPWLEGNKRLKQNLLPIVQDCLSAYPPQKTFLAKVREEIPPEWDHWLTKKRKILKIEFIKVGNLLFRLVERYQPNGLETLLYDIAHNNKEQESINSKYLEFLIRNGLITRAQRHYRELESYYQEEDCPLPETIRNLKAQIFTPSGHLNKMRPEFFVGRSEEMQTLRDMFHHGGQVLILGVEGVGKKYLVDRFLADENIPSQHIFIARCNAFDNTQPYQPITNMINDRQQDIAAHLETLPAYYRPDLQALLHPDQKHSSPSDITLQSLDAQVSALKHFAHLLTPFVLVIHDIQWADNKTQNLLHDLIESSVFARQRHLLLLTCRTPCLPHLQEHFTKRTPYSHKKITLKSFAPAEIQELAQQMLHTSLQPGVIQKISAYVRDNNHLLVDIFHELKQDYDAPETLRSLETLPLTTGISDYTRTQMEHLPRRQKDLIYLMTAYKHPISAERLFCLSQYHTSAELLNDLQDLENLRLVTTHERNYTVLNLPATQLLFDNLPQSQQALYYKQIAQMLEENPSYAQSAHSLAFFWEQSGHPQKALKYYLEAARHADSFASVENALKALNAAEKIIFHTLEERSPEEIYHLYRLYDDIAFGNDNPAILWQAAQQVETLSQSAAAKNKPLFNGMAHTIKAHYFMAKNQFMMGLKEIENALNHDLLSEAPLVQQERSIALCRQGTLLYMSNQFQKSLLPLEASLQIAQKLEQSSKRPCQKRHLASVLYELAFVHGFLGNIHTAFQYAKQGLKQAQTTQWRYGQIIHYSILGGLNYMSIFLAEADTMIERGLALAKQGHAERMLGYLYGYQSMIHLEQGHLATAWYAAQKTIETGQRNGHDEILSLGHRCVGDIYRYLNNFPQAAQEYEQGAQASPYSFVGPDNLLRKNIVNFLQSKESQYPIYAQIKAMHNLKTWLAQNYAFILLTFAKRGNKDFLQMAQSALHENLSADHREILSMFQALAQAEIAWRVDNIPMENATRETLLSFFEKKSLIWATLHTLHLFWQKTGAETWRKRLEETLQKIETAEILPEALLPSWTFYKKKIFQRVL